MTKIYLENLPILQEKIREGELIVLAIDVGYRKEIYKHP